MVLSIYHLIQAQRGYDHESYQCQNQKLNSDIFYLLNTVNVS